MSVTQLISLAGTVLVVDDDASARTVMVAALQHAGFVTLEAANGAEAIATFCDHSPDVIVLDVEMPVMDGYQACAAIRALPGGTQVPIMMVTGRDDLESVNRAYEVGATDFLPKPVPWGLVGHRVRYLLRSARFRQELQQSENRHRSLLGALPDVMLVLDEQQRILDVMGATEHPAFGGGDALGGQTLLKLLPAEAAARFNTIFGSVASGATHPEFEFTVRQSNADFHFEARVARYDATRLIVLLRDVTARRRSEERVKHLMSFDALTGLPNRRLFSEKLVAAAAAAHEAQRSLAVVHIDIDRFHRINEGFGPAIGDRVLKEIGSRLSQAVQKSGLAADVARFGGDEFSVLLRDVESAATAREIAQQLGDCFAAPLRVGEREFYATPAFGIAVFPQDGQDVATLLRVAQSAAAGAKAGASERSVLSAAEVQRESLDRLGIEADLRRALASGAGLRLAWQPQVDARSGRVLGFEALVRWHHPVRGDVPPAAFVPIAEESALIIALSEFVFDAALRQANTWRAAGFGDLRISVNVSGAHFLRTDMATWVEQGLARASLPPRMLELEITESLLMRDIESTTSTLARIKKLGVRLAVDDFGTGYSALAYLKRFSLDSLKIDRSFVKDLLTDSGDAAICSAVIAMAHRLGMEVVAEGVETSAQLAYLREQGCDAVQGYLLGKPMSGEDSTRLLLQVHHRAAPKRGATRTSGEDVAAILQASPRR